MSDPGVSPLSGALAEARANGPQRKTRTIPTPKNGPQEKRLTPMTDAHQAPGKGPEVAAEAPIPVVESKDAGVVAQEAVAPPVAPVFEAPPVPETVAPSAPEKAVRAVDAKPEGAPVDSVPQGAQEITVYEAPAIPQLPSAQTLFLPWAFAR